MMDKRWGWTLLAPVAALLLSVARADPPPSVTTLTKSQLQTLISLSAAQGHRQRIRAEIADFLKLDQDVSGRNGYESARVAFKNGDECSFFRLGKTRDGYLFARSDGSDGFTYIFRLDANLKLVADMKIGLTDDGRVTTPPVSLSAAQAAVELPKVFAEWLVVINHFSETAAD